MPDRPANLSSVVRDGLSAWDEKPFLEKVTNIAPGIIYIFNQKTQSNEYSNRSLGDSLGYSAEEIQQLGADLMPTICHPDDLPKIFAHFGEVKKMADGEVSTLEYRMKSRAGDWVWLLSHDTVFERDDDGSVLRHIGVAADITAQKEAEETIMRQRRVAEAALRELRRFSETVATDLVGPSKGLAERLSLLEANHEGQLDAEGLRLLRECSSTASEMATFIEDVFDYSKILSSDPQVETVSLDAVLADVVGSLSDDIAKAKAIIDVGDLPDIKGDALQLRVMFERLISSAVKFRRPDIELLIVISDTSQLGSELVEVSVTDNGKGPTARMSEAFENMFHQILLKNAPSGAGMVPAICQRIALNHGGDITVRSFASPKIAYSVTLPPA